MTDVLGRNVPAVDLDGAVRLIDFGIDLLVDRDIAAMLEPPESGRGNRYLTRKLAATTSPAAYLHELRVSCTGLARMAARSGGDFDWAALGARLPAERSATQLVAAMEPWFGEVAEDARRTLGDRVYNRHVSFALQSGRINRHLSVLSYARQGLRRLLDPAAPILLAAPLTAAPGRLPSRADGLDVFAIVEPTHPFAYEGLAAARRAFGPLADHVRWNWIHGPAYEHPRSFDACCAVEAAIEVEPDGLWPHADALLRQVVAFRLGQLGDALRLAGWPHDPSAAIARAGEAASRDRVQRDLAMLDAVGVPEARPAFVIGRRVFAGRDAHAAFAAAVAALAP
jgi:hypothetical protein